MDKKKVTDALFSARWAIRAGKSDAAYEYVTRALTDLDALPDISEIEPPKVRPIKDGEVAEPAPKPPKAEPRTPKFVKVPGVTFKEWSYKTPSKLAEGLVVHYTVSGSKASTAVGILKSLAKRNLGCMVMDENGIIYVPENFDIFKDAAAHAGLSKWNGRTGLNSYYMGMEICNWGKLDSKTRKLAKGIRSSKGEANIIKGDYEPYTAAQEKSLIQFCHWAKANNPAFKYENVVGHDEARAKAGQPGGKSDPGASLSMTMPKLRELLLKGA